MVENSVVLVAAANNVFAAPLCSGLVGVPGVSFVRRTLPDTYICMRQCSWSPIGNMMPSVLSQRKLHLTFT